MINDGWVPVGRPDDVPMLEGRSVRLGERRIAVFRLPDGWAALDHACPHSGGPLADGMVSATCVTCPLHGWRFDLRTGAREGGDERIETHEVQERDGFLWLRVAADGGLAEAA
ncbi:MAG TPA: Rieske 2Fe-2S domain-containing protein [Solirubrobacteraceae bacterium]|nr:Rieske 2Fe-2S domain-containing protein [Solirubrobacteraceae bacterium]